jgi:hypothetical protein
MASRREGGRDGGVDRPRRREALQSKVAFCARCGSPLTYRHDSSLDTVDVTTATLDFPDRFAPTREIWLEHKLAWEQLNENLAHYPRSSMEGQSISS